MNNQFTETYFELHSIKQNLEHLNTRIEKLINNLLSSTIFS